MSTATCSDHGATVSFNSIINTQETSVDYVCIGEGGEQVSCVGVHAHMSECANCNSI